MSPRCRACLSVLVLALLASAAAAGPREDLLRLVPEDAGFCVVLQDLRNHSERLLTSPFLADLLGSPLGDAMRAAPEARQLQELKKNLEKHLGVSWPELRDEILGDAVVLAYRPPTPQQPSREQELVLVHARSPKLLARLLDRLNEAQQQSGELKELGTREHAGRKYHRRVEAKQESFYYLHGPLLAVSSRESAIREVIDREGKGGGESPVAKQFRLLGAEKAPAAVWLNPRAFEAEMEAKAAAAKGAEAAFLTTFLRCWNALDGVAVTAGGERELEGGLVVRGRPEALPEPVRKALAAATKPSALWSRIPDDALFAAAGRFDLPALLDLLGEFATREDRAALVEQLQRTIGAALGRDVVKDILPYLGPDWGLSITAPQGDDRGWFPHVVLAASVAPGPAEAPVGEALVELLNSYAVAAVLNHNRTNKDALALKRVVIDKVEVKYLVSEQRFPAGVRPAFALTSGHLLLASSPEAIKAFLSNPGNGRPTAGEFPLVRMSLKALRQYVERRREPLADAVAEKNGLPKEEAARRLDGLLVGLGLVDWLELTQRGEPGRTTWTLRLRTTRPLAKNAP